MTDEVTPTRRLDPAVAHHLDARAILALTPHLNQDDMREIRQMLARRIQSGSRRGARFTTWQEAWNDLTGADERHGGFLSYTPTRCKRCHGRKFDTRTGSICPDCMGRGKPRHAERIPVRFATPPTPPTEG